MRTFVSTWIGNCLRYAPEMTAFKYGHRGITWRELDQRVNRLANALWKLGVRKGDKVTLMFHNCIEFVEANYAIQKLGAVPVPINYRFVPREIVYQAENSDSVAYIFEDLWMDTVADAVPDLSKVKHYICCRRGGGDLPEGTLDYQELMQESPSSEPPEVEMEWDDPAVIIYTGGTTGYPKGVVLSYGNHKALFVSQMAATPAVLAELRLPLEIIRKMGKGSRIPMMDAILMTIVKLLESKPVVKLLSNHKVQRFLASRLSKAYSKHLGSPAQARLSGRLNSRHKVAFLWTSFQLFHDAFYPLLLMNPITGGLLGTMLFPDSVSFHPDKVMDMLHRERPWLFGNSPTGWKMILDHLESVEPDRYDKSSVAICATGGGLSSASLKERMLKQFPNAIIWDIFGQTEMTPATSFRFDTARMERKDRSIGRPIVEVRIVDEAGLDVKRGQVGEIVYKGKSIMRGYYKDEGKTSEVIKDGWFYGGDLGYFDESGEIRIVERKSECINTGAEKVFPTEVEEILERHAAVRRACVIGVPDEKWGNSVRAVIQLKSGKAASEEELLEWCGDKLVRFKIPKSIVFAEELPTTPVGKILRSEVRKAYGLI